MDPAFSLLRVAAIIGFAFYLPFEAGWAAR